MNLIKLLPALLLLMSCGTIILVPSECILTEEVCDGIDNNCNGQIDEQLDEQCSNECGAGIRICNKGKWFPCTARKPSPEVCDGRDNDCNGATDDGLEVKPCYPRDNSELLYGPCRFGVERCSEGAYSCVGWIGPKIETCNGVDDDCDGLIDDHLGNGPVDIVFAIDYSGSMITYLTELRLSTASWVSKHDSNDYRFALVGIPSDEPQTSTIKVTLMSNLTSAPAFNTNLNNHQAASGASLEPSIDAINQIADSTNPLAISWTTGAAKVLILYTDETPQSWVIPETSEATAKQRALDANLHVFVFTSEPSWRNWDSQSFLSGIDLENALDNIIKESSCRSP